MKQFIDKDLLMKAVEASLKDNRHQYPSVRMNHFNEHNHFLYIIQNMSTEHEDIDSLKKCIVDMFVLLQEVQTKVLNVDSSLFRECEGVPIICKLINSMFNLHDSAISESLISGELQNSKLPEPEEDSIDEAISKVAALEHFNLNFADAMSEIHQHGPGRHYVCFEDVLEILEGVK